MRKALFLILCLLPVFKAQAQTPVEIYAKGDKYESLSAYQASEGKSAAGEPSFNPEPLNSQQKDFIETQARKLKVKVDMSQVKTLVLSSPLSEATRHQLYVLSVEQGVVGALKDFYQTIEAAPDLYSQSVISPDQMEETIKKAVTASNAPKLLISQPGKVRIMTISTDHSKQ